MSLSVNFLTSSSAGWVASLGAAFAWSFSVTIYRIWGVGRSPRWLNLFKGLVALLLFGVTALMTQSDQTIPGPAVFTLALSGVIGIFLGDWAFFSALMRLGGTLTSAIQCVAPPMTAVLAWVFLSESLEPRQVVGLIVTSVCLAILVFYESRKSGNVGGEGSLIGAATPKIFWGGVALALVAAISQAAGAVVARPVLNGLSPFVAASLRLWFPVLILLIWEILKQGGISNALKGVTGGGGIAMLALAGFLGTFLGLTLMMYGMAHAPLGVALALNSTYPVWVLLWERISGRSTLGARGAFLVLGSVSGIWLMI